MAGFSTEGVMPMMPYGYGNDGMFGGNGGWGMFILVLLLLGRGGFGGYGAGGFTGGELFADQFALQDIKNNQRAIDGGIRGLEQGICSSTYELSQVANNGFYNIGSKIDNYSYETNRNIDSVKYEMAKGFCDLANIAQINTRDILLGQERGTQRILDALTTDKIQDLRDSNQLLQAQLSQLSQTANIINSIKPCPIPAYTVPSPYASQCGYGYGCNGYTC